MNRAANYRTPPKSELLIYKKAKELLRFTFKQAERFPKKYTFTLSNRLKDCATNLIEKVILANEVYVGTSADALRRRMDYQNEAIAALKIMNALLEVAVDDKLVASKYQEQWLERILATDITLKAWIKSDLVNFKKRTDVAQNFQGARVSRVRMMPTKK